MARRRKVLILFGVFLVANVLLCALWYGRARGGNSESPWEVWPKVDEDTSAENVGVPRGGDGSDPVSEKPPQVFGERNLKTSSENDLSNGPEHMTVLQVSREASAMKATVGSDDDKSDTPTDEESLYYYSIQPEGETILQVSRGPAAMDTTDGSDEEEEDNNYDAIGDGPSADVKYVARAVNDQNGRTPNLTDSLSRLASTLNFDYSTCPKDSLVHVSSPFKPKHKDCPSLFVIGTRKGGTTSLINYLSKHPHFVGARLNGKSKAGETMYYTRLYKRHKWKDYMKFFPPPTPGVLMGESSVAYATRCRVPRRIVNDCGTSAKIVYLIRNPYRRFESNYLMRVRFHRRGYGDMNEVFQKQWKLLVRAVNGSISADGVLRKDASLYEDFKCRWESNSPNMLYDSLYFVFLSHWLCNYPSPENIMIVNSEEFFEKPGRIMNQVFTFLGLHELTEDRLSTIVSSVYNQGRYRDVGMTDKTKKLLQSLYEPFTKEILALLKWDVDWSL